MVEYNDVLKAAIERDAATAASDAAHCANCHVDNIADCPNSFKGNQYVIQIYKGVPQLAVRECDLNKRQRAIYRQRAMLGATGLGQRFWDRTFDKYEIMDHNRTAYDAAVEYAKTFLRTRRWLILAGSIGTGKTHLAVAILLSAIDQNCEALFTTSVSMMSRWRSSFQAEDTRTFTEALQNAIPLVIDDLGKEMEPGDRNAAKTKEFMFEIINGRYEADAPTVITTNLNGQQIIDLYGLPVMSRLQEVADIVVMNGPDYRMREV